jgi:inhibitor of KinA sporulation pathway (predicted exonuclease)
MARDLSSILVIDIESTCWEADPPAGQTTEIIEIGLVLLDTQSLTPIATDDLLVKPTQSQVSDFCTNLTTLTADQVNAGISFAEACKILKKKYLAQDRTWASWGDYDRAQFERQCKAQNVGYPFGRSHMSVKNLYALAHGLPHELGMAEALEHARLPLEGTHHRGHDDAKNIAKLLATLLGKFRG